MNEETAELVVVVLIAGILIGVAIVIFSSVLGQLPRSFEPVVVLFPPCETRPQPPLDPEQPRA